jgi:hypothetical protein
MKTIQLTIGEFEISIYANKSEFACLVHVADSEVECAYEYEAGEREIIRVDPNDSQPGWPDSITIGAIKTIKPMEFVAEGIALQIEAGQDIFHLLSKHQVERMEDQILKGVREEAFA